MSAEAELAGFVDTFAPDVQALVRGRSRGVVTASVPARQRARR